MKGIKEKDTTLTDLEIIKKLGKFNLDPCGFSGWDTAKVVNVLPSDGLNIEWKGRVWLNPPYSNTKEWLDRLSLHGNGVALVLASVETRWFQECVFNKASSILFMKGRPFFFKKDGVTKVKLMRATCLVAYGDSNTQALMNSEIEGKLVVLT